MLGQHSITEPYTTSTVRLLKHNATHLQKDVPLCSLLFILTKELKNLCQLVRGQMVLLYFNLHFKLLLLLSIFHLYFHQQVLMAPE
jgi:hypothetical protein